MEDRSGRLILVALMAALGFALIIGFAFWPGSQDDLALNTFAALDPGFGSQGKLVLDLDREDRIVEIIALNDGRIAIVANAVASNSQATPVVTMLESGGTGDANWGDQGMARVRIGRDTRARAAAIQADGAIVIVGDVEQDVGSGRNFFIARVDAEGALDSSFDGDGWIEFDHGYGDQRALDVLALDDGRILVGGWVRMLDENQDIALLRLNADGRPDASFGDGGLQTMRHGIRSGAQAARALLVVERGEILALGDRAEDPALPGEAAAGRFLNAGEPDPTFGDRGYRSDFAPSPEGSALTTGLVDASGAVLAGGRIGPMWGGDPAQPIRSRLHLLRLQPDGTIDPDYKGDEIRVGIDNLSLGMLDLAGLADGRTMALTGVSDGADLRPLVIALRPDGNIDRRFGDDGSALIEARQASGRARLALQALDDRALVAFEIADDGGGSDIMITRLQESATFGSR